MKKIFVFNFFLLATNYGFASDHCSEKAKILAIEEIRGILVDDLANEGKSASNSIKIDIGLPKILETSKNPKGIFERISVPYEVSSGKSEWKVNQLFFFDKNCNRNLRAENQDQKKVDAR